MLVLSRKESQKLKLGDSIVVTVVRVSGDKVRLGIEAPSDVLVLREELDLIEPADKTKGNLDIGIELTAVSEDPPNSSPEHDAPPLNASAISA